MMERRNLFKSALFASIGAMAAMGSARSVAKAASADKSRVVYHLSDAEKVGFVLSNMQNHLDGVGGSGKVTLAIVIHGPALKSFHLLGSDPEVSKRLVGLKSSGVELNACGNTMKAQQVELSDLLPGFIKAERGGVVRLAELQGEGYVYLRP